MKPAHLTIKDSNSPHFDEIKSISYIIGINVIENNKGFIKVPKNLNALVSNKK